MAKAIERAGVLVLLLAACGRSADQRLLERAAVALDAGQPHLAQLVLSKAKGESVELSLAKARAAAAQQDKGHTISFLEEAADEGLRSTHVLDEPSFALVRDDFALKRLRAQLDLPDGGTLPHGTGLVESTPEAEGVRPEALQRLLADAERTHTAALVVLRHGRKVGEWYFGHAPKTTALNSATKSIVSLAVGLLVDDGRIPSLDTPVARWFPEWVGTPKEAITVRHLLNHTSGLATPRFGLVLYRERSLVQFALEDPLVSPPGTRTAYSNGGTSLLAALVARAAGEPIDALLARRVFDPMGIVDFTWGADALGERHGFADLALWPDDFAKLGQLVLQRGEWNGQQLVSREWIERSTAPRDGRSNLAMLWFVGYEHATIPGALLERGAQSCGLPAVERKLAPYFDGGLDTNAIDLHEMLKPYEVKRLGQAMREADAGAPSNGRVIEVYASGAYGQWLVLVPDDDLVVARVVDVNEPGLDEDVSGWPGIRSRSLELIGTYHFNSSESAEPEDL